MTTCTRSVHRIMHQEEFPRSTVQSADICVIFMALLFSIVGPNTACSGYSAQQCSWSTWTVIYSQKATIKPFFLDYLRGPRYAKLLGLSPQ